MSYYSTNSLSYKVYDSDVYSYFDEIEAFGDDFKCNSTYINDNQSVVEETFVNEIHSPRSTNTTKSQHHHHQISKNENNNKTNDEVGCYVNTNTSNSSISTSATHISYVNNTHEELQPSNHNHNHHNQQQQQNKSRSNSSSNPLHHSPTQSIQKPNGQFLSVSGSGSSIDIVSQLNRYTTRDFKRKDWNAEFQTLLSMQDSEMKFSKLSHLARDFVFSAKSYAQIIINELCVPLDQKTIKPIDVGGFAGGLKYHCHNILFKFAMDTMLGKECWMYGGKAPRDDYAAKAASNELKGLTSYYTAGVEGLNYPMMALIDYKGFRLIALSVLPISSETIRYGSSDSGTVVHYDIDELNNKMLETGRKLNLKPHRVGSVPELTKVLASPGDIEAHLGTDNRYYVIDFSRTFPPESLTKQPNINKRCIFYNLLRPEFVSKWKKPLCSDSFSGWQRLDSDKHIHNKEVEEATHYLVYNQIKILANKFDGNRTFKSKYEMVSEDAAKNINAKAQQSKNKVIQGPSDFTQIKSTFAVKFLSILQKRFEDSSLPSPPTMLMKEDTKLINSSLESTSSNNSSLMNANGGGVSGGVGGVTGGVTGGNLGGSIAGTTPQISGANNRTNRPLNQVKNEVQQQLLKIIEEMHRLGINIRHMGRVRYYTQTKSIRDLLLLEMTARSIKTIIRDEMRNTMKKEQGLSEEPFKQIIIQTFNQVLDTDSPMWRRVYENIKSKYYMAFMKYDESNEINIKLSTSTSNALSNLSIDEAAENSNNKSTSTTTTTTNNNSDNNYITNSNNYVNNNIDIRSSSKGVNRKTATSTTTNNLNIPSAIEEYTIDDNWKEQINVKNLLDRLIILTGITLSPVAQYEFSKDPYRFQFVDSDIQEIYANVKHMNIIDYAEGMALSMASKSKQGREKLRLLKMSSLKFQTSLKSNPDNFECLCQLGRTLVAQAESISLTTGIFGKNIFLKTLEDAATKFQDALSISPTYSKAYYELAHVYILIANHYHGNYFKAQANYQMAAINFKKSIENSINIFTLQKQQQQLTSGLAVQNISDQIFTDIEGLYQIGMEGFPSYVLGVYLLCKELQRHYNNDPKLYILYGKSLIYKPYLDEDTNPKEFYYSEAATQLYNAFLISKSSDNPQHAVISEEIYDIAHDIWVKSKVGNRKLYYPTYYVLRLLVRNNLTEENRLFSMYSDALIEIIKMDAENSQPYLEELAELYNRLIKKDSLYINDKLQSAIVNQLHEITIFLKLSQYSTLIKDKLKSKLQQSSSSPNINNNNNNNNNQYTSKLNLEKTLVSNQDLIVVGEIYPQLEELNLSNCSMITDQPVSEFLTYHGKSLKTLKITGTLIADKTISIMANYCLNLVALYIQNCQFIDPGSLSQLHQLPKLKTLDLSKCKLTNEVVQTFHNSQLSELYLRNQSRVSDKPFKVYQSPWSTLKVLDLSSCSKLTDNSFTSIPNCPSMEQLILEACYNLTDQSVISIANHMPKLTKLSLKGCKFITDKSIDYLVRRCTMIRDFKLSRCHSITGDSLRAITDHLSVVLERIDLSMCPQILESDIQILIDRSTTLLAINLSDIPKISDTLIGSIMSRFTKLQHLRLDSCSKVTLDGINMEPQSNSLLTLSLKKSQITNQAFQYLSTTFHKLTYLTLKQCLQLTDESFSSISNLVALEYLDLSDNYRLLDNSMVSICKSLVHLKTLDISSCLRLTTKSFMLIGKYQTKIENLYMSGCGNLTDASLMYILENISHLQNLDVSSCVMITDKSIYCLSKNQIQLESVSLKDCKNITQSSINLLKLNCPLFKLAKLSLHSLSMVGELRANSPKDILKPIPYGENKETLEWKIKTQAKKQQEYEKKEEKELQQQQQQPKELIYQSFDIKVPYTDLVLYHQKNLNLHPNFLEKYLSKEEFKDKFGMTIETFYTLLKWKQDEKKRNLRIY
ncbi:leucine-rich repeat-containing protein (LRR) [Tieghemostelium lacteum]|uniref:Leucine-rich repeat-containing protein (LRR) n=1 Tax=Tieghemostelium lacteum TaxID=361077 RepID=A0A151ZSI6_TIELA|nr:leucine-rich repeat-containing protein (LRR) [Tieghemostelium lacteum]|eukprot:KYQ96957.1 leucine-rich repeat-containing protein (LRR) [Tieghemostelium lacteum]